VGPVVGVGLAVAVGVGEGVRLGVGVAVGVIDGVGVGVRVGVRVADGVTVGGKGLKVGGDVETAVPVIAESRCAICERCALNEGAQAPSASTTRIPQTSLLFECTEILSPLLSQADGQARELSRSVRTGKGYPSARVLSKLRSSAESQEPCLHPFAQE
jgi:hypothetical protein